MVTIPAARKVRSSYGFPCWGCHKSVPSSQSRAGNIWNVNGNLHCSKECADKTVREYQRIARILAERGIESDRM